MLMRWRGLYLKQRKWFKVFQKYDKSRHFCLFCFIDYLENGFKEFLLDDSGDELTKEYLLPIIVDQLIKTNRASVKVLETTDKWFGVTYPEDKLIVQDSINELIEQGIYPEKLWK